jgi:hypothetical protein
MITFALKHHIMKLVVAKCIIILVLFSTAAIAQRGSITVTENPEFKNMLALKRKANPAVTVTDKYKVQIFHGEIEDCKKMLAAFKTEFNQHDGTIVFSTPSYKVWVGNFKNRIEAERNLAQIQKKFPNSVLIKPNK